MEKIKQILSFSKPAYHFAKLIWRKAKPFVKRRERKVIFVFQGKVQDFGIELYQGEPEIRETIRQCNELLVEMGGPAILPYFEKTAGTAFFDDELTSTRFVAIQLAISKCLLDRGYFPNAVLCSSSGVFAAAYAAGAITMKDALGLMLSVLHVGRLYAQKCRVLVLNIDIEAGQQICDECPFWMEIIYHHSNEHIIVCFKEVQIHQVIAFLNEKALKWQHFTSKVYPGYHTLALKGYREEFIAFAEKITAGPILSKPLKCDFYSDINSNVVRANSILGIDFWFDLTWRPALFSDALQKVLKDDFTTFLQFGSPLVNDKLLNSQTGKKRASVINTVDPGIPPLNNLAAIYEALSHSKFKKPKAFYRDEASILNEFLRNFDTQQLNNIAAFAYLKEHGHVHYLPKVKKWLVLGYDEVDYILKNPEIFSSANYKLLDPYLLGGDPAPHKILRSLLQPLFSAKIIEGLGGFAKTKTRDLLDLLLLKDEFDLMKDFAEPLTEAVTFYFFGAFESEAKELKDKLSSQPEGYIYYLTAFVEELIKQPSQRNPDSVLFKIKAFIDDGSMTTEEAKSVLRLFWVAGVSTTGSFICCVIRYLLESIGMASTLKENPELVHRFITEALRLAPSINYISRTAIKDIDLGGQKIPANTTLMLSFESANRDQQHFLRPNSFLLDRQTKRNFSFGTNIHQCIGMAMAKTIVNEVVTLVLKRSEDFSQYRIAEPTYLQSYEFKIVTSLKFSKMRIHRAETEY